MATIKEQDLKEGGWTT